MSTRAEVKNKIKLKIKELQEKQDPANLDEIITEVYMIIYDDFIQNKKVTGLCPPNGGNLQQGKIAE